MFNLKIIRPKHSDAGYIPRCAQTCKQYDFNFLVVKKRDRRREKEKKKDLRNKAIHLCECSHDKSQSGHALFSEKPYKHKLTHLSGNVFTPFFEKCSHTKRGTFFSNCLRQQAYYTAQNYFPKKKIIIVLN